MFSDMLAEFKQNLKEDPHNLEATMQPSFIESRYRDREEDYDMENGDMGDGNGRGGPKTSFLVPASLNFTAVAPELHKNAAASGLQRNVAGIDLTAVTPGLHRTAAAPGFNMAVATPSLNLTGATSNLNLTGVVPSLNRTAAAPGLNLTGAAHSLNLTGAMPGLNRTTASPSLNLTGAIPSLNLTGATPDFSRTSASTGGSNFDVTATTPGLNRTGSMPGLTLSGAVPALTLTRSASSLNPLEVHRLGSVGGAPELDLSGTENPGAEVEGRNFTRPSLIQPRQAGPTTGTATSANPSKPVLDIDPFSYELQNKLMSQLSTPADQRHGYVPLKTRLPTVRESCLLTLGADRFFVNSMKGEGGFARVFSATRQDDAEMDSTIAGIDAVLKVSFYLFNLRWGGFLLFLPPVF
jgi:hypothetical protein